MDQRGKQIGRCATPGGQAPGAVAKPRRKSRIDQWTKAKRIVFLDHLAATCNVKAAVQAAGMPHRGVYALRQRDPAFAEAWADALEQGYQHIEAQLLACALGDDGTEGDGDGAGARPFDFERGMRVMQMRKTAANPRRPRGGPRMVRVSIEKVATSVCKKLDMLAKRLKVDL